MEESDVQASLDVSSRKAIADGSAMLKSLKEEKELYLGICGRSERRYEVLSC